MANAANLRAVVTGASSGIGEHIARELARRGCNLVITARREDRLTALANELRREHGVAVDVVAADLTADDGCAHLVNAAYAGGEHVDILVNNAGAGHYEVFHNTPWGNHEKTLRLNVNAPIELMHRFVDRMLARGTRSYVLNVASVAAYMPMPYFANYAGTKAYLRNFSDSLASELSGTKVTITCLSPGPTRSEFSDHSGQHISPARQKLLMSAERVARVGVNAMFAGRRSAVPGATNKLLCAAAWLLPRPVIAWSSGKIVGSPASERRLQGRAP